MGVSESFLASMDDLGTRLLKQCALEYLTHNFLNRMRKLGAIVPVKEGERGVYRFPTYLHRIYFSIEAAQDARGKRSKTS